MKYYKEISDYGNRIRVQCVCGKKHTIKKNNIEKYKCNCEKQESNSLLNRYKKSALKRGYDFKLTSSQFKHITSSNCFYCGEPPKQKQGNILYNGIDRMDNDLSYILGNVIACCGICNKAKGTMGDEQFFNWIDKIVLQKKELDRVSDLAYVDPKPMYQHLNKHGALLLIEDL